MWVPGKNCRFSVPAQQVSGNEKVKGNRILLKQVEDWKYWVEKQNIIGLYLVAGLRSIAETLVPQVLCCQLYNCIAV